ncbi:hypothetical protein ACH4PU_27390 [Streptomyces sp. NPDC021100]|uniref:hypothetical protein n=1 Tax=Streptomyces sp. NPDC021100 TaxID=3365114 RepID=UPI00379E6BE4
MTLKGRHYEVKAVRLDHRSGGRHQAIVTFKDGRPLVVDASAELTVTRAGRQARSRGRR